MLKLDQTETIKRKRNKNIFYAFQKFIYVLNTICLFCVSVFFVCLNRHDAIFSYHILHEFVQGICVSRLKLNEGGSLQHCGLKTKVSVSYKNQCMKYNLIKFKYGKNQNFIKGLYAVLCNSHPHPPIKVLKRDLKIRLKM